MSDRSGMKATAVVSPPMAFDAHYSAGRSERALTTAQNYVLWRMAQHKYGWGYINGVGHRSAARALERRGLLDIDRDYRCTLTTEGDREVWRRWPKSPAALGTYDRPDGGWDAP